MSATVRRANVRDSIANIRYLIVDALAAMMTPGLDDGKPYGDSRMATMIYAMIIKAVPAKL